MTEDGCDDNKLERIINQWMDNHYREKKNPGSNRLRIIVCLLVRHLVCVYSIGNRDVK